MPAVHTDLTGASTGTTNFMDNADLTGTLTAGSTVFYYGNEELVGVDTDLTWSVRRGGEPPSNVTRKQVAVSIRG